MAEVTIEGSLTPSTYLGRGQRARVELTGEVERKVALGYVKIVERHDDTGLTVTELEADANAEAARADLTPHTLANPPKRNASREDWAEFLAASTDIVTEGKDRDTLIAEWDDYLERS